MEKQLKNVELNSVANPSSVTVCMENSIIQKETFKTLLASKTATLGLAHSMVPHETPALIEYSKASSIIPNIHNETRAFALFFVLWFLGFVSRLERQRMSYLLPHLHSGWAVDQAILAEEERLVLIRFGHDWDETCMQGKGRDARDSPLQLILPRQNLPISISTLAENMFPDDGETASEEEMSSRIESHRMHLELGRILLLWFRRDSRESFPDLHKMDEVLASVAETIKNFAVIYLVDITEVPDFNTMYELYDPSTIMFFFRNKHIMIDLGTGNNNKINWALKDKQEFIDIVETVYRGARKGRGLVIAPKDYSTKYRY
ncbi:hypothetical protein HHK36_014565 [Tetracentron sinense]|uniref:Thioredoxin-like protein YLS8 n=1 Tax=Tetracentron sinense TaxID=13715 RepID=A0A834Z5S7_TETSI|nr:hypothetical protein HHK36_014565 [Tetracentron sinense]